MTIQTIMAGFRKCGIYPFDPNAIDKEQLFRNKLIPSEDVDLALPPSENNTNNKDQENETDILTSSSGQNDIVVVQNETDNLPEEIVTDIQIEPGILLQNQTEPPMIILEDHDIVMDAGNLPTSSASFRNSQSEEDIIQINDMNSVTVSEVVLPDINMQ